ncbi:hypothetical protein ACQ4PT_012525 [Festuca glaucescens]
MAKSGARKETAAVRPSVTSPPHQFPGAPTSTCSNPSPPSQFFPNAPTSSSAFPSTPPHFYPVGPTGSSASAIPSLNQWRPMYTPAPEGAWLECSVDPIQGNGKKSEKFWDDIAALYNSTTPSNRKRDRNQLKQEWQRTKKRLCAFHGQWIAVNGVYHSGFSTVDLETMALENSLSRSLAGIPAAPDLPLQRADPSGAPLFACIPRVQQRQELAELAVDMPRALSPASSAWWRPHVSPRIQQLFCVGYPPIALPVTTNKIRNQILQFVLRTCPLNEMGSTESMPGVHVAGALPRPTPVGGLVGGRLSSKTNQVGDFGYKNATVQIKLLRPQSPPRRGLVSDISRRLGDVHDQICDDYHGVHMRSPFSPRNFFIWNLLLATRSSFVL